MCRLFGIIANQPVNIRFSFFHADKPFKKFAKTNPHGWGIAWYQNKKPNLFKESMAKSKHYHFGKIKEVKSQIIISHVRYATKGKSKKTNTHPFLYKGFVFAHNGTIGRKPLYDVLNKKFKKEVKGETDSEVLFLLIMQFFEATKDIVESIKKAIELARKESHTGLNFLLSNGANLYAFRDTNKNKSYFSLYYLKRNKSPHPINYLSKVTRKLMKSHDVIDKKAVLFSSEPLTKKENWKQVNMRSLITVDEKLNIKKTII